MLSPGYLIETMVCYITVLFYLAASRNAFTQIWNSASWEEQERKFLRLVSSCASVQHQAQWDLHPCWDCSVQRYFKHLAWSLCAKAVLGTLQLPSNLQAVILSTFLLLDKTNH